MIEAEAVMVGLLWVCVVGSALCLSLHLVVRVMDARDER